MIPADILVMDLARGAGDPPRNYPSLLYPQHLGISQRALSIR